MFKYFSILFLPLLVSCSYYSPVCEHDNVVGNIKGNNMNLEVACTMEKQKVGLMNRQWLAPDDGMIFVFKSLDRHAFWMKNTLIPLSIAFINKDMKIIDIREMKALDLTPIEPRDKDIMAIEMNSHWFEKNNIKIGDTIVFKALSS